MKSDWRWRVQYNCRAPDQRRAARAKKMQPGPLDNVLTIRPEAEVGYLSL